MHQSSAKVSETALNNTWVLQKFGLDHHAIVAITDAAGRITYVNELFTEISGYSADELIGNTHKLVNSGYHDRAFFKELFATVKERGVWRGEICNRRKDGELYWVETTIAALTNDQDVIDGYIALRTDVTDQHRTLEAMRRLHEITSDRAASIEEKANKILALGCDIFHLPIGIISHIENEIYTVRYTQCPEGALSTGDTFPLGRTYCSDTLRADSAVSHHHVGDSEACHHPAYEDFALEAYIGAPLYVGNRRFGTINFSGPEPRSRAFSSGELELIRLFGKWMGDELSRHDTDIELERQRLLLAAVSEQARIGAWELDLTTNELYWSKVTRDIHEVDEDFVPDLNNAIEFYCDKIAKEAISRCVTDAIEHDKPWQIELPLTTAKGRNIWVQARGEPVFKQGECVRLFGSFQDITSTRQRETVEREQAQRHQLMVESTAVGFWDWNIRTGETSFSERWAAIIGYSLEELAPLSIDTWLDECHPDDLALSQAKLEAHWRGDTPLYICEARMKHKLGHWVWVHDTGRVVEWDDDGQPLRMIGTHIDITENKRAQSELRLNHQRMTLATESAGICIWEYNPHDNRVRWDQNSAKLYGHTEYQDSVDYAVWQAALHEEDHDWVVAKLAESTRRGRPFDYEFRIRRPDGELRHIRCAAVSAIDEEDGRQRLVGMSLDITEQKNSERALLTAKKEAEAAARAKSDFLATMSHEIRTPMNGVLGMLNLLDNTPLSEDQKNRIRIAQNSAQSLLALINDILDFSKIEANKLELENIEFDLNRILTECVESLAMLAEDKGIELIVDTAMISNPRIIGDPSRVRQILTNLISNAIKFTNEGEVMVTVSQQHAGHQWQISMEVADTGIGIAKSKIPMLFTAFNQLDSSTTREFGGSGLGLAIVRNLCERMGGGITVSSEPHRGSTFVARINAGVSERAYDIPSLKGTQVLLIEDHPKAGEIARNHLQDLGASVDLATNAKDAAELALEHPGGYDLLIMDNKVPNEHWRDSARALSQLPALETALRLLLVPVSFKQSERRQEARDLHGQVYRPLNVLNLVQYLQARQQGELPPEASSVSEQRAVMDGRHVLLVEDNHVNQLVAKEMLNAAGIRTTVVENGQQAIDLLSQADTSFDLILMDCQMPVMDGYQATRALRHGRAGELHQSTPVIAMTAHAMTGDKERCLASGMNDYLAKPVDPSQLYTMMERWLMVESNESAKDDEPHTANVSAVSDSEIWDKAQALSRVVGNQVLLNQLIDMFRSEQPVRLREMAALAASQSTEALREAAHSLKGVAGNLGLVGIQRVAAALDHDIRIGQTERISDHMRTLVYETERFISLLERQNDDVRPENIDELMNNLRGIDQALRQDDYISQKSLEFMHGDYGDAVLQRELSELAYDITSFENERAQSRLKRLLEQLAKGSPYDE